MTEFLEKRAALTGIGQSEVGRRLGRDPLELTLDACLAAIEDAEERIAEYERRVAREYEHAKAVHAAAGGGIDDVIDPAETRDWIASSLRRLPRTPPRTGKKYPYIDTW